MRRACYHPAQTSPAGKAGDAALRPTGESAPTTPAPIRSQSYESRYRSRRLTIDTANWQIWADLPRATISPNIYGQFIEHLGRCVYEGIWVGPDSNIPNEDGFRLDTLRALRDLPTPVLRWPGGCFADDYHWEDGIGPRERRRRSRNLWWLDEDSNEFGTDEFIELCRRIGAEPYICANVGTGTPTEASNWVEYCNGTGNTHLVQLRRDNGSELPYNVRFWGVGNENWACGGNFSPEEYAAAFRQFATFMKGRLDDIDLVAVGGLPGNACPDDWNQRFLATLGTYQKPPLPALIPRLMDHLSIHRYYYKFVGPDDQDFTDAEYYDLLVSSLQIDEDIRKTSELLGYYAGVDDRIGIVVDEWGAMYDQGRRDAGWVQRNTLLDAVMAATTLNVFNRWAEWVTMANISQTVNELQCVIKTDGDRMWLTPTYHAFKLFAAHMGNQVLQDELESPELEVVQSGDAPIPLPLVSTSASRSPDGRELVLTLVNRHIKDAIEATVRIKGDRRVQAGHLHQLAGDDVRAQNSADEPERVRSVERPFKDSANEFAIELPPHSISALRLALG